MTPIQEAINASHGMLAMLHDWDDEGALPIAHETWDRATEMLARAADAIGDALPVPDISPCADGSIDLWWRACGFSLLVNVTTDGGGDFFGESSIIGAIKGPLADTDLTAILRRLMYSEAADCGCDAVVARGEFVCAMCREACGGGS